MTEVEQQLEAARQQLLDLTLRNRLLNFRRTKRSTIVVIDEDPKEIRIGNHSFILDGSYWESGEEVHRIPVDFVRRDKKSVSYTLGYDPKVAFVTEEVNGSTEDAFFRLEPSCFEDGEIKAPVKEKILTLLSMINFC